jgi:protein-S-isoprenylcysteine O-methyltransferase Ste14
MVRQDGPVHMRRDKYLSLFLSFVFFSAGAYLLRDSLQDSTHSDATVVAGALLLALGLVAAAWAARQHLMSKTLHRHLRRHHS